MWHNCLSTIPDVLLDLCGRVEIIRFCFPVLQYPPWGNNGKHIHQSKPIWSHLQPWADTEAPCRERRFHLKPFPFFSFILFTPFYLPLVHTMEAIVVFPAAKPGHKVFSDLCLCFALPTASLVKKLQPLWHKGRLHWMFNNRVYTLRLDR